MIKKEDEGIFQLFIIGFLSIIFFILMFLSVSNSDIYKKFEFNDIINIKTLNDLNNYNLGTLEIKNNGILTSRVKINKLVMCSDILGEETFNLGYFGEKINRNYGDFNLGYQEYIDINSDEKLNFQIKLDYYDQYSFTNKILKSKTFIFETSVYIYELNRNNVQYNYCDYANTSNALKEIKIKLNISEEELNKFIKNEKYY